MVFALDACLLIVTYLEVNRIAAEMGLPTTANVEVCCKRAVPHALLASSRYDGSVYGDRKAHNMAIISECIVNKDKTLTVPKIAWKPKKITGAKFAAALGEDPFMTRFGLWCELTRVAQKPFVENKHTRAGNIIEDDIARYVQSKSRFSLVQPHMIWGYGYKSENNYDFYQKRHYHGSWSFVALRADFLREASSAVRLPIRNPILPFCGVVSDRRGTG